jgi:Arc/MetJ-type ribon-helix-helix transcriptional regulator
MMNNPRRPNHHNMKIITVNLAMQDLNIVDDLCNPLTGIYASRSELIRLAVHEFLIRELQHQTRVLECEVPQTLPPPVETVTVDNIVYKLIKK